MRYVALLRAVNLGGRNTLKNASLEALADELGLQHPTAVLASGNLVFASDLSEHALKEALQDRLLTKLRVAIDVMIRTVEELETLVRTNPFPEIAGNRVQLFFLDAAPPADLLDTVRGKHDERIAVGTRDVFVAYGERGIGQSRLRMPAIEHGTARNMNTVAKLARLAREIS